MSEPELVRVKQRFLEETKATYGPNSPQTREAQESLRRTQEVCGRLGQAPPKSATDTLETLQGISLKENPLMAPAFMEMPPSEILNAANLITNWFQTQGIHDHWQLLGICHRGFAYENEELKKRIDGYEARIVSQAKAIQQAANILDGVIPKWHYVVKEEPGK